MSHPFRLVTFGAIAVAMVALGGCTSASPRANTSTVVNSGTPSTALPTDSSTAGSARPSATPSVTSVYPADVPLTGHNVNPGEKPPVYPAAAKARTQAGANAFAEFYMHTLDWAYATTNPSYMKHYNGASCGLCNGLATGIAKTAAEKHWYLGGRLTIRPATATAIAPVTAPADYCSVVTVNVTATSVVDRTGKVFSGDGAYSGDRFKLCSKGSAGAERRITYLSRTS